MYRSNLSGREPKGIVSQADFGATREEVRAAILAFRDPETGEAPVRKVWRSEELYAGSSALLAPDLIIEWNELWDYQDVGALTERVDWPSGDHRRQGILVAAGERVVGGNVGVRDIADMAATALAFCGISPSGLDGRPISEIAGGRRGEEIVQPAMREVVELRDEDEDLITEHLRGLGYIE